MKKIIPLLSVNIFLLTTSLAIQPVYADPTPMPFDTINPTRRPIYDKNDHIMGSVDRAGTVRDLHNKIIAANTNKIKKGRRPVYRDIDGKHIGGSVDRFGIVRNLHNEIVFTGTSDVTSDSTYTAPKDVEYYYRELVGFNEDDFHEIDDFKSSPCIDNPDGVGSIGNNSGTIGSVNAQGYARSQSGDFLGYVDPHNGSFSTTDGVDGHVGSGGNFMTETGMSIGYVDSSGKVYSDGTIYGPGGLIAVISETGAVTNPNRTTLIATVPACNYKLGALMALQYCKAHPDVCR